MANRLNNKNEKENKNKMSEKCNGFTNWETFTVINEINNNQGCYNYWRGVAKDIVDESNFVIHDDAHGVWKEEVVEELASFLKKGIGTIPDYVINTAGGIYATMLSSSVNKVNWNEVAMDIIDDIEEEA